MADPAPTASGERPALTPRATLSRRRALDVLGGRTEAISARFERPLQRMWSTGFRFLMPLDAVLLFAAMVALNFARFGREWPPYFSAQYYLAGFAAATAIHVAVNYFVGLYEREQRLGARPWLPRIVLAMGIGVAIQGLAALLLGRYFMPRLNLVLFALLGVVILLVDRLLSRRLAAWRLGPPRVVLVGTAVDVALAETHLDHDLDDAIVVGRTRDIADVGRVAGEGRATDVLLLDVLAFEAVYPEPLTSLEHAGIGFLQRVTGRETLLGIQAVRQVAGMPFVRLRTHAVASHKVRLKRLFDLTLVVPTAPLWLLALAALGGYVRIRAGSPVIYRQVRVGRDGALFEVRKFRTMVRDAEAAGPRLAGRSDDRVVRGLAWMRGMRLDELPQLWNVLRGEMSLVGPRPERPELTADIEARVPGYVRRNELPPGLTGLAQVYGRYDTDAEFKLGYDLQYVANWSPVLDLQILVRTVWVVLSRRV